MPRKYVLVSSSSSTEISSLYSTENSDSEPELLKESRNRRARRRGRDVQCRRSEEPQEGLHWWLARWLSSEFAKFAVSVYEGGKGCIRYLSNTALHALSSARTARELQEEVSRSRAQRSRHRHRRRRNSPYPGVSAEVLKVRKSRNRGSRYGRKERPSSPNETYSPLVHRKASKHGHRLQVSAKKQGSSHGGRQHSLEESWIHEKKWIEDLLKEVKSNFKNPVKLKVYKVTPGDPLGPHRDSRSDNSEMDTKISISIEELVSPTYPSGNSDLISTSSGRVRSEKVDFPPETSVTATRCAKMESTKPRWSTLLGYTSPKSGSKERAKELGKLPTPKMRRTASVVRLSPSDLSKVSDGEKTPPVRSPTRIQSPDESKQHSYCQDGDMFYPVPGKRCKVVCEDVSINSNVVGSTEFGKNQNEQQRELIYDNATNNEINGNQNMPAKYHSSEEKMIQDSHAQDQQVSSLEMVAVSPTIDSNRLEVVESPDENQYYANCQLVEIPVDQMKWATLTDVAFNEQEAVHLVVEECGMGIEDFETEMDTTGCITADSFSSPSKILVSSSASTNKLRDQGLVMPQIVDQQKNEVIKLECIPECSSSASVKTTAEDPALLFLLTVKKGKPTDASGVEVSGVSMLENNAISTGSAPFSLPPEDLTNDAKIDASCPAPSNLDEKDLKQVESAKKLLEIHPEVSATSMKTQRRLSKDPLSLLKIHPEITETSMKTQRRLSKDPPSLFKIHPEVSASSLKTQSRLTKDPPSLLKVPVPSSSDSNTIRTPSKGILKDPSTSRIKLAINSADGLKSPSKGQLPPDCKSVHPATIRSSSLRELADVVDDRSRSVPAIKVTLKNAEQNALKSRAIPGEVSNFSVINDSTDRITVVVSETSDGIEHPTSKSTVHSAKSIVESVTSTAGPISDISNKEIIPSSPNSPLESPTSQPPFISDSSVTNHSLSTVSSHNDSKSSERTYDQVGSRETSFHDAQLGLDSYLSVHHKSSQSVNQMQSSIPMIVTASMVSSVNASTSSKTGSIAEQDSQLLSSSVSDGKRPSQPETVSVSMMPNETTFEIVRPVQQEQQQAGTVYFMDGEDSSTILLPLMTSDESNMVPQQHLTFGGMVAKSYTFESLEISHSKTLPPSHEPLKILKKSSMTKSNLPPINEEVETLNIHEVSPKSCIVQQRRPSMVTPGLLKRRSRPSRLSTASIHKDDVSDESGYSVVSHSMSPHDRCPCKKLCECCNCGQRESAKPSLSTSALSRSVSRDRTKSLSKPHLPRIGAIDMSSTPVPKNSFDVLRSPFYAHWDYYDLDQDHPVARFVRRPDQAEFDNTDTVLMKNVRVGGYTIPYLKLQTKEKVTSKMVCNFYKTRKLPFHGKEKPDENAMDSKNKLAEKSSAFVTSKEDLKQKIKCQCKIDELEVEENIWKDYTRDDKAELFDFPTDLFLEKSKCSQTAEDGCVCIDQAEHARTIPVPPTPCESCDCFISDVELESAPQIAVRRSGLMHLSDSEDSSIEKTAIVNEYICGLQELCGNLCAMIGKMRLVIDETSASGSTYRSLRGSPSLPAVSSNPSASTRISLERESSDKKGKK